MRLSTKCLGAASAPNLWPYSFLKESFSSVETGRLGAGVWRETVLAGCRLNAMAATISHLLTACLVQCLWRAVGCWHVERQQGWAHTSKTLYNMGSALETFGDQVATSPCPPGTHVVA